MKRLFYLCFIVFSVSANTFCQKNYAAKDSSYLDSNNNIVFNDLAFELKIKSILKKDSTSLVNITDVENIKELDISNPHRSPAIKIKSIDAIKYFKNLEILYAHFNAISSLKPLIRLAKLTVIRMQNNLVDDISPLAHLVKMRELGLYMNSVQNISALKDLKQLEDIDFFGNHVEDISVLKELSELAYLNLGNNRITDISCLKNHDKIRSLWLYGNRIQNPEVIRELKKSLSELSIANCGITNIRFLSKFIKLETLLICENKISDISPLKNLTHLTTLLANNNQIENIDVLVSLVEKGSLINKGQNFPFKLDLSKNKIDYDLPHNKEIKSFLSSKIQKSNF
jgi:internalin A